MTPAPHPPPAFADFEASARNMDPAGIISVPTSWAVLLCDYVRALERARLEEGSFW